MGGPFVEGRYLLGRLQGRNYFLISDQDFVKELNAYFLSQVSPFVAEVLSISASELGVCYLRHICRRIDDIPSVGSRRESQAVFLLANDPHMDNDCLAVKLNTTLKQVERISNISFFRQLLRKLENDSRG